MAVCVFVCERVLLIVGVCVCVCLVVWRLFIFDNCWLCNIAVIERCGLVVCVRLSDAFDYVYVCVCVAYVFLCLRRGGIVHWFVCTSVCL